MATIEPHEISSQNVDELFQILNDDIDKFIEKNDTLTNEELHIVFYRLNEIRIVQPTMGLFFQYQKDEGNVNKLDTSGMYK